MTNYENKFLVLPGECVFCDIIQTEVAEGFIKHGETVVSFTPLNPVVEGHRLFVPAKHVSHAADGPVYASIALYQAAKWGRENCKPWNGFNLITSAGAAATQTIMHTHVHYVPRREGDGLLLPWSGR